MIPSPSPNFAFLQQHDEQLLRLGMLAEKYFPDDPNTALLKLRQFAELLAQLTASRAGQFTSPDEPQFELIRRLQDAGVLPREVAQLFSEVRRAGNAANHSLAGDHRAALSALKLCWQLGLWYHRTFAAPGFKSGPFVPPGSPPDESAELRSELDALRQTVTKFRDDHAAAIQQLEFAEAKLRAATDEQTFWATLAEEADQAKVALERRLAELQSAAEAEPKERATARLDRSRRAAELLQIDEADTRKLIDQQLRAAGWEADTSSLTWGKGARPVKGRNLAIAEWPTESGPADYVLFMGLTPVATVEAKRKNIDVSGSLQQAKRYSRGFRSTNECASPGGPWQDLRIPFTFSSNGRPYLKQLATRSGVWFCDLRRPSNLSRPLDDWYTPDGLQSLLERDELAAHQKLKDEPFEYGFPLREYQRDAILAAEEAIAAGQRELLLAMATGTGKTKTCIALIYRLLNAQRFGRVLFLVDREALGEQAANAFKDTRMENLQTFADTFGIKELQDQIPDSDTTVHIATIQGMVKRVLFPSADSPAVPVDRYDCIVVDECHRGYLLDRELSDTEMQFRGFEDYVSKYRRVIEHFDAVKVGLTATPALHTTEIRRADLHLFISGGGDRRLPG
jgi:type I restriction enzyme R subunit